MGLFEVLSLPFVSLGFFVFVSVVGCFSIAVVVGIIGAGPGISGVVVIVVVVGVVVVLSLI